MSIIYDRHSHFEFIEHFNFNDKMTYISQEELLQID